MSLDRLGSRRLSWVDLRAFIEHSPRDSAIARSVHGKDVEWGLPEQLMASTVDLLAVANWQRGGNRHAPKPKPIRRPGGKEKKFGKGAVSVAGFKDWWGNH